MKPIKMAIGPDGDYHIDALIVEGTVMPAAVQTSLRNLLLACELGALVIVQCTRKEDDSTVYVLCAYADDPNNEPCILPIMELSSLDNMLDSIRPPAFSKIPFKRPKFLDSSVQLIPADEGVSVMATIVKKSDDSVH